MNKVPDAAIIAGIIGGMVIAAVLMFYFLRSRTVNLTRPASPDEKPEWLRTMPPSETVAATQADGEGITVFDHDPGEALAAPFAEQIEDILQAQLHMDATLSSLKVDLGTGPEGELEIIVDGQIYNSVDQIPNERLRQAFRQAIEKWEKTP